MLSAMSFDRIWFAARLGQIAYPDAWDLQLRLVEARQANRLKRDTVLLLEHPPVFTLGKRGGRESLLVPEETLAHRGIPILQVERGGNITYHGPGQLVVYPIVHLPGVGIGVVDMVDRLEEVMIRTCGDFGVAAGRNALNRGAWIGMNKIGSIGLAVRRGVSFHGLALNVDPDLTPFGFVQPCGLQGVGVTSIVREAGRPVKMEEALASTERNIEAVFGVRLESVAVGELLKKAAFQF
ncbi:MAG: lipoyl(octanoyl) transferase LipB [Desulfobacterales bacterium]|nr:lipoyl(octanoyl) transferase LipB [Desulfobacterales bacterium]